MKRADFEKFTAELHAFEHKTGELESSLKEKLQAMGYGFLFDYYCLNTIGIAILIREIKDIKHFYRYSANGQFNKKRSLRAFKKFLGLAVTSNQSGTREGGHTLAGANTPFKNILFLMAMRYVQINPDKLSENEDADLNPLKFKAMYEQYVSKGKKKLIAFTKVMSKIATDLFFILKSRADTQPQAASPHNQHQVF
jgi:hypothetical protein